MKKLLLLLLLLPTIAQAADNAVVLTPGTGVTMRSIDIGAGVQSSGVNLVGSTGASILGTAGTANANVLTIQGIAGGTSIPVSAIGLAIGSTTAGSTGSLVLCATTTAAPTYTTAQNSPCSTTTAGDIRTVFSNTTIAATQSGTWTVQPGNTPNTTPWLTIPSSQYPSGSTPITASATGTTAATTATLAGTSGKTTYICGYSIRANATAATTVTNTITGVITATLSSIMWVAPLASGIGIDEQIFMPCIPASATNTGIAIVSGAPGSGGTVSSKGWGYQL